MLNPYSPSLSAFSFYSDDTSVLRYLYKREIDLVFIEKSCQFSLCQVNHHYLFSHNKLLVYGALLHPKKIPRCGNLIVGYQCYIKSPGNLILRWQKLWTRDVLSVKSSGPVGDKKSYLMQFKLSHATRSTWQNSPTLTELNNNNN